MDRREKAAAAHLLNRIDAQGGYSERGTTQFYNNAKGKHAKPGAQESREHLYLYVGQKKL